MSKDETEAEIQKEVAEMIAADSALTQEQRNQLGRAERIRNLRKSLLTVAKWIEDGTPEFLIATSIHNIYGRAWGLYEADMARELTDDIKERTRRHNGLCVSCGNEMRIPYTDEQHCDACKKDQAEFDAEMEAAK